MAINNLISNQWASYFWFASGAGVAFFFRSQLRRHRGNYARLIPLAFGLCFAWLLLFLILDWIY